jgi:putative hydrolase of the HAD superfamily
MAIKLVIFDAAGVLFPVNKVVGEDIAKQLHLDEEELVQKMWKGFYIDYTRGTLSTEQFLDRFAETFNVPRQQVTEALFTDGFIKALVLTPGIDTVLRHLMETGVLVAMLSDTTEIFARARDVLHLNQYFDRTFLSFEIGHKKPEPEAFQVVLGHYGVQPNEVFFIDDNAGNVAAAQQMGMQAVQFTDAQALSKALQAVGVLA